CKYESRDRKLLLRVFVPEGTELGINYKSWQVGSCFQGVKMIPPGLHLLHYCSSNLKHQEPLHRMKRDGTELRFSPIPRQTYPPGATPAQITQCSPDLSYSGKKNCSLHLCVFSLGPCTYEGFEHGKRLLALLCRSESPDLYLGLIAVLYQQLGEIPPDFSVDIVSQDNYLTSTLQVSQYGIFYVDCSKVLEENGEMWKTSLIPSRGPSVFMLAPIINN
uniref:Protein AAR2 homolog n=1 Tax=Salmo trutta TaxID=8032 RepID=A0A674CMN1_SALTR